MLLETSILVDILRKDPAAKEWIESLPDDAPLAIPGISVMELIRGQMAFDSSTPGPRGRKTRVNAETGIPQDHAGVRQILESFRSFPRHWASADAQEKALQRMAELYPTHRVSLEDHLIAFTAIEAGVALATRDSDYRHFKENGLSVVKPYEGKAESSSRPERTFDE